MHSVHLIAIKEQSNGSRLVLVFQQGGRCIMHLHCAVWGKFQFWQFSAWLPFLLFEVKGCGANSVIVAKLELRPQIDTNCSDSETFEQLEVTDTFNPHLVHLESFKRIQRHPSNAGTILRSFWKCCSIFCGKTAIMSDTQENWLCMYQSEAQPLVLLDKWSPPGKMDEHQSLGLSFQSSQSLLDLRNVKFWREIFKEKSSCQKDSYLFSREGRQCLVLAIGKSGASK